MKNKENGNSGLKEFFRFTKGKLITASILLAITLFFIYLAVTVRVFVPANGKEPFISNPIFWIIALPSLLLLTIISLTETWIISPLVSFIILVLLQLVYVYILASSIVWIGKRMKRRNLK